MPKPFKTYEQQIVILQERGLQIPDTEEAKCILQRENYYSVINGYKDFFLESPDRFLEGTTLDALYHLFLFDRNLRTIVMPRILILEHRLKSIIAYEYAKDKGECSYLDYKSYEDGNNKHRKNRLSVIAELYRILSQAFENSDSIEHYFNRHYEVPIWVLVNHMTLGAMSKFFTAQVETVKARICRVFRVAPDEMAAFFRVLVHFRNVCAHSERFYNQKIKTYKLKKSQLHLRLDQDGVGYNDVLSLFIIFKHLLDPREMADLLRDTTQLLGSLQSLISQEQKEKVLQHLGFVGNWQDVLSSQEE